MKPSIKLLIIVLGVEFLLCVLGLGGAVFFISQNIKVPEVETASEEEMAEGDHGEEHGSSAKHAKASKKKHHNEPGAPGRSLKPVVKELDEWRAELNAQKEKLIKMDQDILRRSEVLKAEREALDKEKAKILEMQKNLNERMLAIQASETQKYKDLAAMFGKMKVDQVVVFLRMFPDDQTSRLMSFMPNKVLIKILEHWSSTYPDDRERLVRVTSQIRRVIQEPLVSSANDSNQVPEIQTQ